MARPLGAQGRLRAADAGGLRAARRAAGHLVLQDALTLILTRTRALTLTLTLTRTVTRTRTRTRTLTLTLTRYFKTELETLAFAISQPQQFAAISAKLAKLRAEAEPSEP